MLRSIGLAALLALAPATAFAHSCPTLMEDIDAELETASLSEDEMTTVGELRTEGEELHAAGDHDGSMEALEEAKEILGID